MTSSNHEKMFTQLKAKPNKLKKYKKHNAPKERSCGQSLKACTRCGRKKAHLSQYGLHVCRQCFRDYAEDLGFKQYS